MGKEMSKDTCSYIIFCHAWNESSVRTIASTGISLGFQANFTDHDQNSISNENQSGIKPGQFDYSVQAYVTWCYSELLQDFAVLI